MLVFSDSCPDSRKNTFLVIPTQKGDGRVFLHTLPSGIRTNGTPCRAPRGHLVLLALHQLVFALCLLGTLSSGFWLLGDEVQT